jgi:hypothetical protein
LDARKGRREHMVLEKIWRRVCCGYSGKVEGKIKHVYVDLSFACMLIDAVEVKEAWITPDFSMQK